MRSRVLSPHYPDVLRRLPRRSPDDSGVPPSAPPGSHAVPPARSCATREGRKWEVPRERAGAMAGLAS